MLKQPEVEAELIRLRTLGQAAAVMDLARKREWLASIINDPSQKTADRLRAMKLDAELAGDLEVSLTSDRDAALEEVLEQFREMVFQKQGGGEESKA